MYGTCKMDVSHAGWCRAVLHEQFGRNMIRSIQFNSFPILLCMSWWHRSPAAQGMAQTAVRAILKIGVCSLLRRHYLPELRANGRNRQNRSNSLQISMPSKKNVLNFVFSYVGSPHCSIRNNPRSQYFESCARSCFLVAKLKPYSL